MKWLLLRGGLRRWRAGWLARSRQVLAEGAVAAEDRIALARLEWAKQRHQLVQVITLAAALGTLVTATLVLLALALLVQLWDTPYRVAVAWLLVIVSAAVCAMVLALLVSAMRAMGNAFALTRRELARDWQVFKEQLTQPLQEQPEQHQESP